MKRGVVISYDSRHFSPEFAEITARTLTSMGIRVYLSDELRPVPMLSYSVRWHKAFAGVMITASHNPSKYNGYKVYGEDGGQVPPEAASKILSFIEGVEDIRTIHPDSLEEAKAKGLLTYWGEEVDEAYTDMLDKEKDEKHIFDLASGGFSSTVRLAKSNADMWVPILTQNRDNVLQVIDTYLEKMTRFRNAIADFDEDGIRSLIEDANRIKKIIR